MPASRRWSKGLTLLTAYTFSKAIDQGSFPTAKLAGRIGTAPQNRDDFRAERGLANFDQRHRFTSSGVCELPSPGTRRSLSGRLLGGWQLSGILTLASGSPFIIQDGTDLPEFGVHIELGAGGVEGEEEIGIEGERLFDVGVDAACTAASATRG